MTRSTLALTVLFAAVLTLSLAGPASVARAQKTPTNATSVDVTPAGTSGFVDVLYTMELRKWRKKRILRVDAVLEVEDVLGNVTALLHSFSVNGLGMVAVEYNGANVCSGTTDCTVNASAWIDLDDAAAADPDAFKGQPLAIEIVGRAEVAGAPLTRRLRAVAQLIKK